MKFVAPIEHEITASIAPVTRELPRAGGGRQGSAYGQGARCQELALSACRIDPQAIASSPADLVVVDYAGSNVRSRAPTSSRCGASRTARAALVLAYMSIGQAETYRWYCPQRSSSWSGQRQANYSVRFWLADWQKIIFEYTEKIVTAGSRRLPRSRR